jgi:hypothetical protein
MHNYPYCSQGYSNQYPSQVLWYPSDSEELFNKNLKENYDLLKKYGWLETSITYNLNKYGFRSDDFQSPVNALFFGCSFTFGIGLQDQDVWVNLLKNKLGISGCNLGVPGGSMDTAFRLAYYWIKNLKPKYFFLLAPSKYRREYFIQNKFTRSMVPNREIINESYEKPLLEVYNNEITSDHSSDINFNKNLFGITYLCEKYNSKLFVVKSEIINFKDFDRSARDLIHCGLDFQTEIVNLFLKEFNE